MAEHAHRFREDVRIETEVMNRARMVADRAGLTMATVIPFPARRRPAGRVEVRAVLEAALEKTLGAVDHLVARLDELEEDPDIEEGGDDEPSLGAPVGGASQAPWAAGSALDEESG